MVKSPIKVITSGNAPTASNTVKGDLAFGYVGDKVKLYGNNGTEVVEILTLPDQIADPTAETDIANKRYVDNSISSINLQKVTDIGSSTTNPITTVQNSQEGIYGPTGAFIGAGKTGEGVDAKYATAVNMQDDKIRLQHSNSDGTATYVELTDDDTILKQVKVSATGEIVETKTLADIVRGLITPPAVDYANGVIISNSANNDEHEGNLPFTIPSDGLVVFSWVNGKESGNWVGTINEVKVMQMSYDSSFSTTNYAPPTPSFYPVKKGDVVDASGDMGAGFKGIFYPYKVA